MLRTSPTISAECAESAPATTRGRSPSDRRATRVSSRIAWWTPRGQTPSCSTPGRTGNDCRSPPRWRFDGMAVGLACTFKTTWGTYTDTSLIGFLRAQKQHVRGLRIVLIWKGRSGRAHESLDADLPRRPAGLVAGRTAARLRPRSQSRRVALGQSEGPGIGGPSARPTSRPNGTPCTRLRSHPAPARARLRLPAPCRLETVTCASLYLTRVISCCRSARGRSDCVPDPGQVSFPSWDTSFPRP